MLVVAGHTLNLVAGVGGFNSLEPVQHFEEAAVKCIDPGANLPAPRGLVTLTSSETSLGFSLCICKMKIPLAPLRGCGKDEGGNSTQRRVRRRSRILQTSPLRAAY